MPKPTPPNFTDNFHGRRLRRLRQSPQMRNILQETHLRKSDLIYPIFVEENIDDFVPINSMPGVSRIPESKLEQEVEAMSNDGVQSIMLFGVSHHKDEIGSDSLKSDGLLARIIQKSKSANSDMIVMADACFCEYTDHSHCGVIDDCGFVDNDLTLENLAQQAVIAAQAGADIIAPSAMMDGQVLAIREALDENGYSKLPIMSYSSKFASSFYGPFREAAGSQLKGDRKQYQMNPMNAREALLESILDEDEGADILMVKPGMPYLDILHSIRQNTQLPIACYQVSGEYAMIKFASQAGALDEKTAVLESLGAMKRAGADLILSYFTREVCKNWNEYGL